MKMSGDPNHNGRLVKCPKCRKLLPEPSNVPFYMCGGCGAILQAKVRTNNARDSKNGVPQTDVAQLNKLEQDKRIGSSEENIVSPAKTSSLIHNNETSHDGSGNCTRDFPEDWNIQIEIPSSAELTHRSSSPSPDMNANKAPSSVELTQYSSDLSSPVRAASRDENINFSGELPSSAELMHHSSDPLSPAMDVSFKVNGADDRTSVSWNENIDQMLMTSANTLINSVDTPSSEDVSSNLPQRPAAEPLLNFRQGIARLSDFVKSKLPMENGEINKTSKSSLQDVGDNQSTDTAEMEETNDPIPKLNEPQENLPGRSAYTDDGSISSNGTEDQVLYKHKRAYKDDFIGDAWSFSSSVDKRHPMRQGSWGSEELLEPIGYPTRGQMRMDDAKHLSTAPSDPMGDQAKYEYGGSSSKQENPEQERLRLLRMVYDLQNQIHQIQIAQEKSNSRAPSKDLWSANYVPSYVNQEAAVKEMDHGFNHSSHLNEGYGRGRNWSPYSGPQVDPGCLGCNAQLVQCSMQLPYPVCCCKEPLHEVHLHPGEYFYNPPSCFLPGHRQYIESDASPNSHDMKLGDQKRAEGYVEYEKTLRSRSVKQPVVKRHFLPVAGAAPLVACYLCKNVLQLPADFLLFRKGFHELRCGACSKILKFSLENNSRILPYFECIYDRPPGELDSGSDAFYGRTYASGNGVTSSSLSTETEQLRHIKGDGHNRMTSTSSLQSAEGRRSLSATNSIFRSSSHRHNGEQLSSEIEEKCSTSGSPLHRLMGYDSISQVIRGPQKRN